MERTYDVFADNGLFVLSYYLGKSIQDISIEDIEKSVEFMGDKTEEFLNCEKYSNLKLMFLFNSVVSNPSLKNVKLKTILQEFVEQAGDDYCMICGGNHANIKMNLKGRSYLPNRPADTYFNFSNNLHNINICPYCLLLTVYSIMNCRVNNYIYLYNTSDNNIMARITSRRQEENKVDIKQNAKKQKNKEDKKGRLELLLDMIDENVISASEVEIYQFTNSGESENILDSEKIYHENVELLRKMRNKGLLTEFRQLGLSWMIIKNRLKSGYLKHVYDFDKDILKCSKELFEFLNKEVNMLDKNIVDIVDRMSNDILDANLDTKKIRANLKAINSIKSYTKELMYIFDTYFDNTNKKLFDTKEYNLLVDVRKYYEIRNMLLIGLVRGN